VRECRRAAGLTQTELAGQRFSKEYISQIERGKTSPSDEALAWIAQHLQTDVGFLEHGVSAADRAAAERAVVESERLSDEHDYTAALQVLDGVAALVATADDAPLTAAWTVARAWALVQLGELEAASELLDGHEADQRGHPAPVFLRGVVAYKLSHIDEATRFFGEALALPVPEGLAGDRLHSDILSWRSRCHRRSRDWDAAREDSERAIELAESGLDNRRIAYAAFQASLVHERMGNWVQARRDAERALDLFEAIGDRANVGHILNNLGGLAHLLGDSAHALELLHQSFLVAVETGSKPHAAHVLCSIAEVRLATNDLAGAERDARNALDLFDGRIDYLHEIGIAQLTLGRTLLDQGRTEEAETQIRAAEDSFARINSPGHEAAAEIAHGDLAARRGSTSEAADRYRQAATSLLPNVFPGSTE